MTGRVFVGTQVNQDTGEIKAFFGSKEAAGAFKAVAGKHVVDRAGALLREDQIKARLDQLNKIEEPNKAVVDEIDQLNRGQTAIRHRKDDLQRKA